LPSYMYPPTQFVARSKLHLSFFFKRSTYPGPKPLSPEERLKLVRGTLPSFSVIYVYAATIRSAARNSLRCPGVTPPVGSRNNLVSSQFSYSQTANLGGQFFCSVLECPFNIRFLYYFLRSSCFCHLESFSNFPRASPGFQELSS
jgi:hypothetical protein